MAFGSQLFLDNHDKNERIYKIDLYILFKEYKDLKSEKPNLPGTLGVEVSDHDFHSVQKMQKSVLFGS